MLLYVPNKLKLFIQLVLFSALFFGCQAEPQAQQATTQTQTTPSFTPIDFTLERGWKLDSAATQRQQALANSIRRKPSDGIVKKRVIGIYNKPIGTNQASIMIESYIHNVNQSLYDMQLNSQGSFLEYFEDHINTETSMLDYVTKLETTEMLFDTTSTMYTVFSKDTFNAHTTTSVSTKFYREQEYVSFTLTYTFGEHSDYIPDLAKTISSFQWKP